MTMSDQISLLEEELSYYEEEISVYETGLSTIHEADNEDDSSVDSMSTKGVKSSQSNSSFKETPKPYANSNNNTNALSKRFMESPGFDLVSPPIFSPKFQFSNLRISPLAKLPSVVGNLPLTPSTRSLPSPSKQPGNLSLSMTHHLTGEDLVIYDDDDEYTFVSCSDTDSFFGDLPFSDFDGDESSRSSLNESSFRSLRSSSASLGSLGSASSGLDFDTKRTRLEEALERRTSRQHGNLAVEVDGFRRKLRYDLSRRMFKEKLLRCRSKPREMYVV
jgi:hypothetical protein